MCRLRERERERGEFKVLPGVGASKDWEGYKRERVGGVRELLFVDPCDGLLPCV